MSPAAPLWARWRRYRDVRLFARHRADYYDYLADLVEGTAGRRTLRGLFLDDAARYGEGAARGRLSAYWALRYEEQGGDLFATFAQTLPHDECVLLRLAQRGGAGALEQTLRDLAAQARLVDRTRRTWTETVAAGVVALAVLVAALAAVPLFTVPRLRQAFGMVPDAWLGRLARRLYGTADLLSAWGPGMLAAGIAVACLVAWSLPNWTGAWRGRAEACFPWRLYRDVQGIRFLASLATLVRKRGNVTTALREALDMQGEGARPWLRWHLDAMVARIDDGRVGRDTFDTGLLDRRTFWFLSDLIGARGLDGALARVRAHIEARVLRDVARQAAVARWCLLLVAVAALLGLVGWHMAVVHEMRIALTHFYSTR